ncbi:tetratricopeptide repeat protein [Neotamlana laminarinivorans]|uniref:Tetratricopeptide repeat protein n=1 Tax=Neotamlana laminarinivorans TaxID=2883124 RepID=A0A9X1I461_9FLAO|nr:tetratricopeptide repeat protein [Tamlana laminarinivorans]MCB4800313.1 tetratricopeptide repeat protein [Tamlana laminarinivorans]
MKNFNLLIFLFSFSSIFSQPNCEAYKYYGETLKYEACKKAEQIENHYQFSKKFQEILDESIFIDSTFAYAYREKSVAYLKSGDFITWKRLIDKAVKFNIKENLGYRGWCRYQFFRDYKGAIKDIEKLDTLVDYDIGQSINGTYHLNIAKGLCYKAIGEKEKAIKIIENQIKLNEKEDFVGAYDYLHLGVLYLETERLEKAIEMFKKQSKTNELAENQYYLALTYRKLDNPPESISCLKKAKELYIEERKMFDPYSNPMDKIYLENIENEIKTAYNNGYK